MSIYLFCPIFISSLSCLIFLCFYDITSSHIILL
uniref:Uncharacterized protein n=1 Tax=Rhizophora mucronata TaxID=61149 RepID=A0A2P2NWK6_RHIMU